jgi:hypothetical protein
MNPTEPQPTQRRVLALYENGGHHVEFTNRAVPWLNDLARATGFVLDCRNHTRSIDAELLEQCGLFLQLDYPPYGWADAAASAFEEYISAGKGGWIGLHHASLLGEFDGFPMWHWFSEFLGGIRYQNYIATFAQGVVRVEDAEHPVMQGVPASFLVEQEEWYTYNRSPRSSVHVLATVDESTYQPDTPIRMGDHPVVWTNPHMASRNLYIFMGHSPRLFDNEAYVALLRNAILWGMGG